ncbi:MAG: oligopeptide transporter, OPT family, partial [Acidobacteria bacterium]|nr:oligopeptide transporter, OPT family [Acidobacteriota bacterium]
QTPAASPILFGVGYIIGTRISAILFAGALMGWLFLVPLGLFFNPNLEASLPAGSTMLDMATEVWSKQVRPLAVGTMIVAAFYTLWNLRTSLMTGITRAFRQFDGHAGESSDRTQVDLSFKKIFIAIGLLSIPMFFLYQYFSHSFGGALLLTVVMIVLGFLFAAVAGYLVGLIGSSNNPISGLTLSALIISALLMVWIGVTGVGGVAAVLAIAGVVCCAAGVAGDMMQDLKVGHLLGGTPWRMEISEIIGVIAAAAVLTFPLQWMDTAYGIGSAQLPAPQAGLMALLAQGIVGGEMAWGLVIVGMFLAFGLILIGAPSPMLIAVGMYLPFYSTSAIFVGGLMRWAMEFFMNRKKATKDERTQAENVGVLLSSGFIAGESLMAVLMALLVIIEFKLPTLVSAPSAWPGLIIFVVVGFLLIWAPLRAMKSKALPATPVE